MNTTTLLLPKSESSGASAHGGAPAQLAIRKSDPLLEGGVKLLQVDPERDQLSSNIHHLTKTVNADIFLEEGVSLSGTHYGLNLISSSGVVFVAPDARILPSKTRPSTMSVLKIVNAGEMVLERLKADALVLLADGSKTILGDVVYGQSFVITETANWRVLHSVRKSIAREKSVTTLFNEAVAAAIPDDNGYDAVCTAKDAEIEAQQSDSADNLRPRLATVGSNA